MPTHTTLASLFSDIADEIRAKKGTSETIVADNFPDEIASIPSGGGADLSEYFNITPPTGSITASTSSRWVRDNLILKSPDITLPAGANNLTNLCSDLNYCPRIVTSTTSIVNMKEMYRYNNAETIDISGLDLSKIKGASSIGYMFGNCPNLKKMDLSSWEFTSLGSSNSNYMGLFNQCFAIEYIGLPKMNRKTLVSTCSNCARLKTLVISDTTGVYTYSGTLTACYHMTGTVSETYNPDGLKDGRIYVPDTLVDSYKEATGWSTFADQILPLSQLPEDE